MKFQEAFELTEVDLLDENKVPASMRYFYPPKLQISKAFIHAFEKLEKLEFVQEAKKYGYSDLDLHDSKYLLSDNRYDDKYMGTGIRDSRTYFLNYPYTEEVFEFNRKHIAMSPKEIESILSKEELAKEDMSNTFYLNKSIVAMPSPFYSVHEEIKKQKELGVLAPAFLNKAEREFVDIIDALDFNIQRIKAKSLTSCITLMDSLTREEYELEKLLNKSLTVVYIDLDKHDDVPLDKGQFKDTAVIKATVTGFTESGHHFVDNPLVNYLLKDTKYRKLPTLNEFFQDFTDQEQQLFISATYQLLYTFGKVVDRLYDAFIQEKKENNCEYLPVSLLNTHSINGIINEPSSLDFKTLINNVVDSLDNHYKPQKTKSTTEVEHTK